MEGHSAFPYLREIMVFLIVAGIVIPSMQRLKMSPVMGYLGIGALVGPLGVTAWFPEHAWLRQFAIADAQGVHRLAELGVVLLLFVIGLELSLDRLWGMRRWVFGAGALQVAGCALVIGVVAFGFGNGAGPSLLLGMALALSSTAVAMQLLAEKSLLAAPIGRASFAVLLLQDLAVVPLIVLIGVMGAEGSGNVLSLLGIAFLKAALAVAAIFVLGRFILRPLFHHVSVLRQPETFMALTLLSVLGISTLTWSAGLSMALGAFLAGLLLAETEYRHEVEVTVEPFKGLLLGLFFITVGMGIDLQALLRDPVWIFAAVLGLMLLKAAIMAPLFRLFGLPKGTAIEAALLLSQGGEFAFIIIGMAMAGKIIDSDVGQFMMLVVSFTMLLTPLMSRLGAMLGKHLHASEEAHLDRSLDFPELEGHVLLAGYGRVGQLLGRILEAQGVSYIALDSDAKVVQRYRAEGKPIFYGSAIRAELLRRANLSRAAAVVVTLDHPSATHRVVSAIRKEAPGIPIVARARDSKHAAHLKRDGATVVVPETLEASLQLAESVLEEIGVSQENSALLIRHEREAELSSLA